MLTDYFHLVSWWFCTFINTQAIKAWSSSLWLVAWSVPWFGKELSLCFFWACQLYYTSFSPPKSNLMTPSHASRKIKMAVAVKCKKKTKKLWGFSTENCTMDYIFYQKLCLPFQQLLVRLSFQHTELSSHLSNVSAVKHVAITKLFMLNCQNYRRYGVKVEKRKLRRDADGGS